MNTGKHDFNDSVPSWQESVIQFFDQASNFVFYVLALFILIIPPVKWISDRFPSTDNGWWVLASIVVFVIILPLLIEVVANVSIISLEKLRR